MSKLFTKRMCWTALETIIRNGDEFHNNGGSFRGVHRNADDAKLPDASRMPQADYHRMQLVQDLNGIDYVVYSYQTVIAYRDTRGVWHVPDVSYSKTTTSHQCSIRVATKHLSKVAA